MPDLSVVIVGGGVAGLAVANALAARGCRSTVLESTATYGEVDRGDVIHSSSLAFFERWNAVEILRGAGALWVPRFRVVNHEGEPLFQVDLERELERPAPFIILRHPDIQRVLATAAIRSGHVTLEHGVRALELLVEDNRVAGVRTTAGVRHANLVVVANGAFSALRDRYFPARDFFEYSVSFLNLRCRAVEGFGDAGYYVLGPSGVMILAPLPAGEMRIGLQVSRRGEPRHLSTGAVRPLVRERLRTFPVDSLEIIDQHLYRITKSLARSLAIPGGVVAGDAAHTTHPVGAQGMNLAFQDAEELAECLADVEFTLARIDEATARYSAQARRRLAPILARTHVMGLIGSIRNPAWIRAREGFLRVANRTRLLKRTLAARIVEVR